MKGVRGGRDHRAPVGLQGYRVRDAEGVNAEGYKQVQR